MCQQSINLFQCLQAGANMIVSGTAVIGAADQANTIKLLRETVQSAIDKR